MLTADGQLGAWMGWTMVSDESARSKLRLAINGLRGAAGDTDTPDPDPFTQAILAQLGISERPSDSVGEHSPDPDPRWLAMLNRAMERLTIEQQADLRNTLDERARSLAALPPEQQTQQEHVREICERFPIQALSTEALMAALLMEILGAQTESKRRRLSRFNPDVLTLLNAPPVHGGIEALWAGRSEFVDDDEGRSYMTRNGKFIVSHWPSRQTIFDVLLPDEGERIIRQLTGQDDAKVVAFIICLGKWLQDTGGVVDPMRQARVDISDILTAREIKEHHNGGWLREQKLEVRRDVETLNELWVRSTDVIERNRRKVPIYVNSRLFEVAYEQERDEFGDPVGFRVRPGDWVKHYLDRADGAYWTTKILRPLLRYHVHNDRMPLRIGLYLAFQWRIRLHNHALKKPFTMLALLEGTKLLEGDPDSPPRNEPRYRQRIEEAIAQLHEDKLLAVGQRLEPPDGPEPWKDWLAGRWRLEPPQAQLEAMRRTSEPGIN